VVKLLPLAAMVFGIDGRSAVDPNLGGIVGRCGTGGTAELRRVNGVLRPVGRVWREGFHEAIGEKN
jgi:hypothetical protein